ncbi:hypothetical protein FB107DRAFT_222704 [Schizophyllum commune]
MARNKTAAPATPRKSPRLAARNGSNPDRAPAAPVAKKRARDAARRTQLAQALPPRRSARIRSMPPKSYKPAPESTASPPSVPPSQCRPPDNAYMPHDPVPSYKPQRSEAMEPNTPRRRLKWQESRPTADHVAKVALSGRNCSLSGSAISVQIIHHTGRGTEEPYLKQMEITFGEDEGCLNLDTRGNLMPLDASVHDAYDDGFCVFSPTASDLNKLHTALVHKRVDGWSGEKPPHTNAHHFIHHEEVFPMDGAGRKYHVVPSVDWDTNQCVPIKAEGDAQAEFYRASANKPLPLVDLHCSPYFVVYKAYWALIEKNIVLPDYMRIEEQLIRKIGEIMTGKVVPPLPKA